MAMSSWTWAVGVAGRRRQWAGVCAARSSYGRRTTRAGVTRRVFVSAWDVGD